MGNLAYPRTIEVHRLRTNSDSSTAVGVAGYSGAEQSTSVSDPQGEDVLFTAIPSKIEASQTGRKKDGSLPQDAVWAPTWRIYIPSYALAQYSVRDRDIILDDESYRYEVGQDYWSPTGYQLVCIRLEA